jgi:hypothetical protein
MSNPVIHLLLCASLGIPLVVSAQTASALPAAADSNAAVAPLQYRSVFADALRAAEPAQAPDQTWRQANRIVAGDTTQEPDASAPVPAKADSGTHMHPNGKSQ